MHKTLTTVALAAMLTIPVAAQTQPTAAELLQKGIYAQETAGDLDGAVKIYRQIVDAHPQQREIGAQAQYRLGMTLLAKGDTNSASQEIQRLGWDYPDYKDLIASAKKTSDTPANGTRTFFVRLDPSSNELPIGLHFSYPQRDSTPSQHDSMFDFTKSLTVTGVVSQVQWMNPYAYLTLALPSSPGPSLFPKDPSGSVVRISVASPNVLTAAGWDRGTLKLGDQVTVTGAPALDGTAILQATSVSTGGKPLFSRPAIAMDSVAGAAYEK